MYIQEILRDDSISWYCPFTEGDEVCIAVVKREGSVFSYTYTAGIIQTKYDDLDCLNKSETFTKEVDAIKRAKELVKKEAAATTNHAEQLDLIIDNADAIYLLNTIKDSAEDLTAHCTVEADEEQVTKLDDSLALFYAFLSENT